MKRKARKKNVQAGPAAGSELLGGDQSAQAGPADRDVPAQTDIERAIERNSDSVETVPQGETAAGLASFIDRPGNDGAGADMPPYLREK